MINISGPDSSSTKGGVSVFGVLTIVFVVLKLCKVINWSWLWVLCPTWIPLLIYLVIFAIIIILSHID